VSAAESLELFLQEASDHLQYLREYSGLVQEPQARAEDFEKLYIAAHTLCGTSASYGFPLFSEVAGKLAHIFQYAMNARLGPDTHGPLTEFLADAVSVLEFDLLQMANDGTECAPDIAAFKQRYSFAFPAAAEELAADENAASGATAQISAAGHAASGASFVDSLPEDSDIPAEVLEVFVAEAEEHFQTVTECLLALEGNPNAEDINRLFRAMHTVKGSAAQVGVHRCAVVAHRVEELIGRMRDGRLKPSAEIVDLCLDAVDALKKLLHHSWANDAEMRAKLEPLLARIDELAPAGTEEPLTELAEASGSVAAAEQISATELAVTAAQSPPTRHATSAAAAAPAKSVRISLDRLDRMMNAVGELVINRTRMLGRLSELSKLVEVLTFSKARLSLKVSEFQDKHEFSRISSSLMPGSAPPQMDTFRGFSGLPGMHSESSSGFSELEMDRYDDFNILSRSLSEISADVTEVLSQLEAFMNRVDSDIDEFTKLAHHLQDEITRARMVPIGNLYTRLSRTVRDAAKATGKRVALVLDGAETELDNNIIQQISDPLIHLVRNAVAHGIEKPEVRTRSGKSDEGRLTVRAYHRGNHVFVEVEDDGGGINYEKIRVRALETGRVTYLQAEQLTERELREYLFQPGFSTADSKTELAGRGVGLDVVRANIHTLNGDIEIRSDAGAGTVFTLKVPLTLIISQALFVRSGTSVFAFPLAFVEEIRRLKPEEIEEVGGKLMTKVRGVDMEAVRLDAQLGLPPIEPINGYYRMVIVKIAGRSEGIIVEDVLGKDEIVIKNLGEYLRRVKLFPGTSIASDGSLILLIDLNRLVAAEAAERRHQVAPAGAARIFAPGSDAVAAGTIPAEAVDAVGNDKVIVVVDDSISVRKFVGRMLEKAGYRVILAADGLEASEVIAHSGCHLVLTDLEMPRMNGYELMAHLRQNPVTREIPVMVVTSRAGAKHRDRAMKDGAVAFLTKPVQEDLLIETVEQLIGEDRGAITQPAGGLHRA